MIIARNDQGGTRTVVPLTGLDQPSTAGSCAALHWVGTDMVDLRCIPPGCPNSDHLRSAAQDADEGLR